MKERDYINATNLTYLRCAARTLRDALPMGIEDETDLKIALMAIRKWEERLEKLVQ